MGNVIRRSAGQLVIDAPLAVTGAVAVSSTLAVTGASTLTGAVGVTGLLTHSGGEAFAPAAIAAAGTMTAGYYVFNGADGAVNLPQVIASANGYQVTVANMNGTGTATVTAPVVIFGAAGSALTRIVTPYKEVTFTAYAAGTCWFASA